MWLEQDDPQHAGGRFEDRTEASFILLRSQNPDLFEQIWTTSAVREFLSISSRFASEKGQQPPVFPRDGSTLAGQLLSIYFNTVGSFTLDDETLVGSCVQYCGDLEASATVVSTLVRIGNFEAESEFDLIDGVIFRQLGKQDIDRFGRIEGSGVPELSQSLRNIPWLNTSDWICEIERISPKNTMEVINGTHDFVQGIVTALGLSVSGRAVFSPLATNWKSPYIGLGMSHGGNPLYSSGTGGRVALTNADKVDFQKVYDATCNVSDQPEFQHLSLPLRRFRLGSTRSNNEDRLVDFVVGLENLLACDSPNLETTFRFRLRGGALLPDSYGTARNRINRMGEIYDLRSRVVHGTASLAQVDLLVLRAEEVFKLILRWYIDHAKSIGDNKMIVKEIDEAIVGSGIMWAYESSP